MKNFFQLIISPDPFDFVDRQIILTGKLFIIMFGLLIAFFAGKFNNNLLVLLAGILLLVTIAVLYFRELASIAMDDVEWRTEAIWRYEASGTARRYQEMAEA